MKVKGTAFEARKNAVIERFGEEKWRSFLVRLSEQEPYWEQLIFAVTLIPARMFLLFQDELVKEFYGGDPQAFWEFGVKSAEWSLIEGPYKHYLQTKDVAKFVESVLPTLWIAYYTTGKLAGEIQGNVAHIRATGASIAHIHFEFSVMGYIKRALELMRGNKVKETRIKGFDSDDGEIYYQFVLDA